MRLLLLCVLFLIGCGDSSKPEIPESLTPHAAINLNGGTAVESNLEITSDNALESGISVINGGVLTLNDSTIIKTAPAGSTAGGPSDTAQAPNPFPGDQAGMSTAPPDPNQAPGAGRGAPDPSLAPSTPGPPGTPGGAPPPGEEDKARGGGSAIGSRSSGVYAGSKGSAILSNITIDTNLQEGKGLCAIDKGSSITLTKGTITTAGRSSHGVFASLGGEASLKEVSITTKGEHSSAVATDTGGGKIIIEGGAYTASGKYSSGIYSTGDIRVSDATFKSEADNAAVMEYSSKISLVNTSLWSGKKGAVMIFQSVADTGGISEYKMAGGSITATEGPFFYVTNTTAAIDLKGVKLSGTSGILLKALKGDWGSDVAQDKPTRGGTVTFIADGQTLPGDIALDENSSVTLTLKNKSAMKGAINADNKGKEMNLALDSSSTWDVTADSYLNALTLSDISGDTISNIRGNGHTVYYNKVASSALGGKTYNLEKGGKLQPR